MVEVQLLQVQPEKCQEQVMVAQEQQTILHQVQSQEPEAAVVVNKVIQEQPVQEELVVEALEA